MYSTEFQIGDKIRIKSNSQIHYVIGIEIKTYIGLKGKVKTNYILYLGNGLWRSARACELISKRKNR